MNIGSFQMGVPVLRLETNIEYSTPRKPTAFERVILQIVHQFSHNREYAETLLETICVKILCLPNPGPMIIPTLSELHSVDVIYYPDGFKSFSQLKLRDLSLTNRGEEIIQKGMIPGYSEAKTETFLFDPIENILLSTKEERHYVDEQPSISLDASLFQDLFPQEKIRTKLQLQKPDWLTVESQIETIRCDRTLIVWKEVPCTVVVENQSVILVTNIKVLDSYLASIESEETFARLLEPFYDTQNEAYANVPKLTLNERNFADITIQGIQQVSKVWPTGERYCIAGLYCDYAEIPGQAPPHQVIILYRSERLVFNHIVRVDWNESADGCIVWVDSPSPFGFMYRITTSEWIVYRKLSAFYGRALVHLNIACTIPTELKKADIQSYFDILIETLSESSNHNVRMAEVLLTDEASFRLRNFNSLSKTQGPLTEFIETGFATIQAVERITGRVNRHDWEIGLVSILVQRLKECEGDFLSVCVPLLSTLSLYKPYQLMLVTNLFDAMIPFLTTMNNSFDLLTSFARFHELNEGWYPSYPCAVFNSKSIARLLSDFPRLDVQDWLCGNLLLASLHALLLLYKKLVKLYSLEVLEGLESDQDYLELLKTSTIRTLYTLSKQWVDRMYALVQLLPEQNLLDGTYLAQMSSAIERINGWAAKLVDELPPTIKKVFIFDTSALLEKPEIVSSTLSGEFFVVSKRVLEELDNKKLDDRLRKPVAMVQKNLANLKKEQVHFSEGDMTLLSPDYQYKGDNLILSVAVRYRFYAPVLVTNDNNLALKARAENITTMTAQEHLDRPKWSAVKHSVAKNRQ